MDAGEDEHEARRNEREAEQHVADGTRPIEADEIEQPNAFAAREAPQQQQASRVDQGPVNREPRLGVVLR